MSLVYEHHDTRDDWLAHRGNHLGASEAGAILGVGFQSKIDLWKIKTGRMTPKDLSDNAAVAYGNRAEDALRRLFMAKHPELALTYHPYDFVYQSERPYMKATLDGELIAADGQRLILEIKTAYPRGKAGWEEWNGRIPDKYYAQCLFQMLCTEFRGVYLFAELMDERGSQIREYYFDAADCTDDMAYLLEQVADFWKSVETGRVPTVPLRI